MKAVIKRENPIRDFLFVITMHTRYAVGVYYYGVNKVFFKISRNVCKIPNRVFCGMF